MNTFSSDDEPAWLTKKLVRALHAEALGQFGGSMGMRDEALLEAALDRPKNRYAEGDPSIFELAAVYCAGIVQSHPFIFIDGNKRLGLLSARAFLFRNGYYFDPDEAKAAPIIRRLAADEIDEAKLIPWVEEHTTRRLND